MADSTPARTKRVDAPAAPRLSSEILDRQPPCDLDAERAVLGSILLDPRCVDDVALALRPDDFYSDRHQKLYRHLIDMNDDGVQVDSTLLVDRLRKAGDFEAVGGAVAIAQLVSDVPHAAHAAYYANIVSEKSTQRALIYASSEILRDAYEAQIESRSLLGAAEEKIFSILERRGTGEITEFRESLVEVMLRIDEAMKTGKAIRGLETHFHDLDDLTGGFQPAELIILAARPSMGKTALACNIAEHVAVDSNVGTLFVSLEMDKLEVTNRLLYSRAGVNGHKLRDNSISEAERAELVRTSTTMHSAPLFIDDTPSRSMMEIAAIARRLKRKNNLGLIIIDYLQLIEPDNSRDPRQEQVAKIARRLKILARELHVPVLCLAQLNRQAEATKDNRPRLSHLRESGAIEQDADSVLFIHREEVYHSPEEVEARELAGKAVVIVAKNRNGPVGDVNLAWRSSVTRFESIAMNHQVDPF